MEGKRLAHSRLDSSSSLMNSSKAPVVHLALGIWGLSSWILFNGIWGQLAMFVRTLPEGNKLGVLILTAEQLAYVFPLLFMLKRRCFVNTRQSQETDIWILLTSGLLVSVLLAQYWDFQALVDGVPHSVGLLVLAFFTGAICSSTGLVFTPYLANLPKSYTSAHTAGAGLSGLGVAVLTLVADSGSLHPRLSARRYFNVLSILFLCSMTAFLYIQKTVHDVSSYEPLDESHPIPGGAGDYEARVVEEGSGYGAVSAREDTVLRPEQKRQGKKKQRHWPVFTLQCLLSALTYGVVPSILPMACSGYINQSQVLMLATVGFMCADPLGKIATSFLPTGFIFLSGFLTIGFAAVILLCAAQSSTPPFSYSPYGGALPVVANTLFSFAFSFTSISIFFERRRKEESLQEQQQQQQEEENGEEDEEAYQWFAWSAFMIQTGAFLGTMSSLAAVFIWS